MANRGPNKKPRTSGEIRELGNKFREVAESLDAFATEMERLEMPAFAFATGNVENNALVVVQAWMIRTAGEFALQKAALVRGRKDAQKEHDMLVAARKKHGGKAMDDFASTLTLPTNGRGKR